MKIIYFLLLSTLLFSCKKQEKSTLSQNPKMIFDGKNIIDINRNDSIICQLSKKINLPDKFNFTEGFNLKSFLISNKELKISKVSTYKNTNQFSINDCLNLNNLLHEDKIIDSPTTYNIEYKNHTTTLIVEFSFRKEKDLINAYTIYSNYCTFLRNLRRDKYQFRCCELFDEMFYYCTIKGNKLYLISDLFNYSYTKPYYNVESNIKQNKDIIMDDIYFILNSN